MLYILPLLVIMLIFYFISRKYTPKNPGYFGYKTKRATQNQATWTYANKLANNLLLLAILLVALLTAILSYGFSIQDEKAAEIGYITFTILSILILPVTEYALHRKFTKQ